MYNLRTRIPLILAIVAAACPLAFTQSPARQTNYPAPVEGDYTIKDFKFRSGETLPELKLHYATIGTPAKDNSGVVRNAVLIMHGTGGTGAQFFSPQFANVLFGPGQLLDATKYFIILPDAIGHGGSSKPSNGLHMKFPHYTYDDMVLAQYRLITEKLGVNHLRLVMGHLNGWNAHVGLG
jgi:homoserine O-acetyltransferase/O-succinyltransferase